MINLIKNIFTWWNSQTLGTMIYTLVFGKLKGTDNYGNKYYESKSRKRWIIYKNEINASKIAGEWYSWMHFLDNKVPDNENKNKYLWEKEKQPNFTGTNKAYRPKKIIENKEIKKKYETWKN